MGALWQPEQPAGHAPWCVTPYHSLGRRCEAGPDEPQTLRGRPSRAWRRDHPDAPPDPEEDEDGQTKLIRVRIRAEYTAEVRVPADADAAMAVAKANETPVDEWDQSWYPPETEEAG
jgi:hypothetical protein